MKKFIFVIILCLSAFATCPVAYAKEAESGVFEITSGLDFSKDSVSTFDSSKTVSGTAAKNTNMKIEVYSIKSDTAKLENDYSFTVGISGIFTQAIDLNIGENYIVVSSGNEEKDKAEITVNRKKEAVKKALEKGVYLP